jgi:hypothetical protein
LQILRYAYQARDLRGLLPHSALPVRVPTADRDLDGPREVTVPMSSFGPPGHDLDHWPPKPTVVEPAKLQATVAAIVKVLAAAQIEYAARRAAGC